MKINRMIFRIILPVLALGAGVAGNAAMAQGQESAAQNMPNPQVNTESCAQVQWAPQIVEQYPRMPQACQEVVTVNGVNWARFSAKLLRMRNSSVVMDLRNPRGGSLGTFRMKPAADAKVLIDGQEYTYAQLSQGQVLHFYIQEGQVAVATEPSEPAAEMAMIEPPPAAEVAQAEPTTLPKTAGPLPWVALGGVVFVLIGAGLTLGRRFSQ